jgi:hypothetical protein
LRGRRRGGRGWVKNWGGPPILEDKKFWGSADQILCSPMLKADSFQNVEATLVPAVVPREVVIPEDPSISFLPYLPENEAWEKFPNTV